MAFDTLSVTDFKETLSAHKDAIILDVRTPEEVAEGAIENAINIDYYNNNFLEEVAKLDKSKPYFVYCRSGKRSTEACRVMELTGFTKLYNLQGGFLSWS